MRFVSFAASFRLILEIGSVVMCVRKRSSSKSGASFLTIVELTPCVICFGGWRALVSGQVRFETG